ncbi:hypothetical protein IMCC3317_44930 [Kordia antarctica]|uniref:Uncharacterized protein n=1 Tax=Kordia antarctica TaxID=1218801 RepID=A0A7L4ZR53_9FLAO|nr:hypothetical protein [Kordia antarctica]QHI39092.1 hypothetical protein IMCC3317_44930 [Kordia antarctica]
MKLEYNHDLTDNGKFKNIEIKNLIRLWDFGCNESKLFQELINSFVLDASKFEVVLEAQEFITSINCKLTLIKSDKNNGIERISEDQFICNLNLDSYKHMINLIEPFINHDSSGYQWLDELANPSEIDFLFSPGGTW